MRKTEQQAAGDASDAGERLAYRQVREIMARIDLSDQERDELLSHVRAQGIGVSLGVSMLGMRGIEPDRALVILRDAFRHAAEMCDDLINQMKEL